jgi:hypothetical protein
MNNGLRYTEVIGRKFHSKRRSLIKIRGILRVWSSGGVREGKGIKEGKY